MNKQFVVSALALSLSMSLSMCTAGTETDNPLVDFDASECKTGEPLTLPSTVMRSAPGLELEPDRYSGLHCFAWDVMASGNLRIDVLNYPSGCGAEWDPGDAAIRDDEVSIMVRNAMCAFAACGSCIYDFSFELAGVDTSRPVELTLNEDDCTTVEPASTLSLPLDDASEGIVCRETRLGVGLNTVCGMQHAPPCSMEGPLRCDTAACDDGLTCFAKPDAFYDACYEACEADDDCSLEIDVCQGGLCRLRETF